jgi:AbrB family looped-hinge helix DNA binding protein
MAEATLSSKNQIVIPREAREALGAGPGDKLLVVVRDKMVVILPRPRSWTKACAVWQKEPIPKYMSSMNETVGNSSPSNTRN